MKKTLIIIIITFSTFTINSQIINSFGINNGLVLSNQKWVYQVPPQEPEHNFLVSFGHSFSMSFLQHKHWNLNTSFGTVQHGFWEYEQLLPFRTEDKLKVRFNYLYLSTGIIIKNKYRRLKYYLKISPRINYRFNHHSDFYYPSFFKGFKKYIPGIDYGIGIAYNYQKLIFNLEILKSSDLIPLIDTEPDYSYFGLKVTTEIYLLSFGVSYLFGDFQ